MATKNRADASLLSTLLAAGIYKKNQGRLTRQLTVLALWTLIALGCYTLKTQILDDYREGTRITLWIPFAKDPVWALTKWGAFAIRVGIPVGLAAIGAWMAYRAVNYPRFADFLVSVEAEMAKVSWPGRDELYRATVVVIVVMVLLAVVLFGFDYFWQWFFRLIGVIGGNGGIEETPPAP
jgi:preprotein translocase subunit SecE